MKKFKDMTKRQKAVAIAKDVLKQIAAKTYKATPGVYVMQKIRRTPPPAFSAKDLKKCEVCAIGSCFVSAARLGGQKEFDRLITTIQRDEYGTGGEIVHTKYLTDLPVKWDGLAPYFDAQDIQNMESAFEPQSFDGTDAATEKYKSVKDPTMRLKKIMRNVIRNRGHFIP